MAASQPPAAAGAPPSAQVVGNAFVTQYYQILHQSPDLVYRFYQEASRLGRPSSNRTDDMDSVTTMELINEKIMTMDMTRAEIKTVDSQESLSGGVTVLVTGHLTGGDGVRREFSQSFFLAPQEKGYFVLNDMFRYVGEGSAPAAEVQPEVDAVVPPLSAPMANGTAVAAVEPAPELVLPPQREQPAEIPAEDEEQPVPEVIDAVPNNVAPVMTTTVAPVSREEAPKKSYASIVKVMKEAPLPAPASYRPAPPKPEKQSPAPIPAANIIPLSTHPESSIVQEPDVDAHAVYVRGLPLDATPEQLEEEFKKFGTIKPDGIQVRSHKMQGYCYGFVEFEEPAAVQSAMQAKSAMIGDRECFIEAKRTAGSRGSSRGRFAPGRGSNFRAEGVRGRGNYGGGRNYGRSDFGYRSDYGGRSGGRGGSGRGADVGYQRVDRGGRTSPGTGAPAK